MSSDLAARLRCTYHVADLPEDSVIRLAADALDAARSQVEAAHKRAADADALLREARERILWASGAPHLMPDAAAELVDRINAHLGGGNDA